MRQWLIEVLTSFIVWFIAEPMYIFAKEIHRRWHEVLERRNGPRS